MTHYAYLFEARSLQSYIFDSGKLRDIIGASELIESLTMDKGVLDDVLAQLSLTTNEAQFARRAGGALVAVFQAKEHAQSFSKLWSFTFQQIAPELGYTHALGCSDTALLAVENAREILRENAQVYQAKFPQAGPFIMRNPRNGKTVVSRDKAKGEYVDRASLCFRQKKFKSSQHLTSKFGPSDLVWPLDMTPDKKSTEENKNFPFIDDERYVGIIHADGNGLGQLLIQLEQAVKETPDKYLLIFRSFSELIDKATQNSARIATKKILIGHDKVMPARPIVLGGDDLTIIVRGDLAIPFTNTFIETFEKETRRMLKKLGEKTGIGGLPEYLSACAGIAFVKANQPFYMAYHLAESLCAHAKTRSKLEPSKDPVPSSIAFHMVSTSIIDNYTQIIENELSIPLNEEDQLLLSYQPYAIGEQESTLPQLEDLYTLCEVLDHPEMSRGPAHQLMTLLYYDSYQSNKRFERWKIISEKRIPASYKAFTASLGKIIDKNESELSFPFTDVNENVAQTPLNDALIWNKLGLNGLTHEKQ